MIRILIAIFAALLLTSSGSAENKFTANIAGGAAIPIDEFSDFFNNGYGGQATFGYQINPGIQLTLTGGLNAWTVNNDHLNSLLEQQGIRATINLDAPFSVYPVVVGVKYLPLTKGIRPFFTLFAGLHILHLQTSGTVTVQNIVFPLESRSKTWSEFGFGIEFGLTVPLGKRLSLEAMGKYNAVDQTEVELLQEDDPGTGLITMNAVRYFNVFAGLSYAF
ncbi:MAG: outer membrane beta-barrel protein [Bacteroidota bacterium]